MKRRVAVLVAPRRFEIIEEDIPPLAPDEVLVSVLTSGLCHSDVPAYLGESTQAFDEFGSGHIAAVKFPLRFGHEVAGRVEAVGSGITKYAPGDYVTGLLRPGYSSHVIVKDEFLLKIPTSQAKDRSLCIAEPIMCVVNILRTASPQFGDTVAVVGCGSMGLMIMAGLKKSGARHVVAIDLMDSRLDLAKQWGATHTVNPKNENPKVAIASLTNGKGADVVIEISGNLKGFHTALSVLRDASMKDYNGRGKLLIPSLYGRDEAWPAAMGYELMFKAPIIHSTHPRYAVDVYENFERAVDAYMDGTLPFEQMITHRYPLEDIGIAFEQMISGEAGFIKGILIP